MKKRILSLAMVLALLAAMVVPTAALADTTEITGTVAETPTVTSVTPNTGDVNTTPTVTIIGTNFVTGQTTVQVSGTGVTPGAATVNTSENVTCVFTIASNAPQGAKTVKVTVAGKQSVTSATFTVNGVVTVVAPSAITLGYMTAGTTKTGASTDNGTMSSNWAAWKVTAIDAKLTNTGKMNTAADGSGTSLAALFQIAQQASGYAAANTGFDYTGTYTGQPTTPVALPFFISQDVASNDPAGAFTITITFTGATQ